MWEFVINIMVHPRYPVPPAMVRKIRVLECPSCGSTDVAYEAGLITGQKYRCGRCGYVGAFIIERDVEG